MATLTFDNGAVWDNTAGPAYTTKMPGQMSRGRVQAFANGGRLRGLETAGKTLVIVTGTYSLDSSYPTGGEDVSAIAAQFPTALVGALFEQPNVAAVRTVALSGTSLLGYTDGFVTQVANGTNLSAITGKRFIAWGY